MREGVVQATTKASKYACEKIIIEALRKPSKEAKEIFNRKPYYFTMKETENV